MGWFNWGGTASLHDKVTLQHFQHARCMESLLPWLSDIAGSDRAALHLALMAAQRSCSLTPAVRPRPSTPF